ncbi:MAG TPA: aspartyl protease family protein [Rhizomicrobium sp.]|nr:aspartyl protease family protein [Rhizomicrobium sp.]
MRLAREAAIAAFFLLAANAAAGAATAPPAPKKVGPDVLFEQGLFDAAEAGYQAVSKTSPGYEGALRQLGAIALYRNHPQEAELRLRNALAHNPADARCAGLLAETLNREGKFAEMAQLLRQIGRPERAAEFELFARIQPYRLRGRAAPVTIPFEQTNPLPAVRAKVNDLEGLFLIDTGGAEILLDPEFAREAHVATTANAQGPSSAGRPAAPSFGRIAQFALPGLQTDDVPAMLLSTKAFSSMARGKKVAGIIGTEYLSQFRATLDYVRDRLILEPREAPMRSGARTAEIPFWMVGDHFLLAQGRLDRGPKQLLLVDTGFGRLAFTAPESTLRDAGITMPAPQAGPSGRPPIAKFPIAQLSLGSLEEKNISGIYGAFPPGLENGLGVHVGGIVSHEYFLPYAVTFDFVRMKIGIRK